MVNGNTWYGSIVTYHMEEWNSCFSALSGRDNWEDMNIEERKLSTELWMLWEKKLCIVSSVSSIGATLSERNWLLYINQGS